MKNIEIEFVGYDKAEDLVIKYFRFDHPRMKLENLLKLNVSIEFDFEDDDNQPFRVSDVIESVKRLGMWGFCDLHTFGDKNPVIHYWVGPEAKKDKIKVMELFSHEIAHASGYKSERMATKFGGISAFSYMAMMQEIYKKSK